MLTVIGRPVDAKLTMQVRVNGHEPQTLTSTLGGPASTTVKRESLVSGRNVFELIYSMTKQPSALDKTSNDARHLAFAFERALLEPTTR